MSFKYTLLGLRHAVLTFLCPTPKGNLSFVSSCLIPNGVCDDKGFGDLAVLSGCTLIGESGIEELLIRNDSF